MFIIVKKNAHSFAYCKSTDFLFLRQEALGYINANFFYSITILSEQTSKKIPERLGMQMVYHNSSMAPISKIRYCYKQIISLEHGFLTSLEFSGELIDLAAIVQTLTHLFALLQCRVNYYCPCISIAEYYSKVFSHYFLTYKLISFLLSKCEFFFH